MLILGIRKKTHAALIAMSMTFILGAATLQATVINSGSNFNFRNSRFNAPVNFRAESRDDAIVFGANFIDDATGLRPEGILVSARNSVTDEVFALNPFGSTGFSAVVGYTAGRAAGDWQLNVQTSTGTSLFTLPGFGTGPGTQALPGVDNLAVSGEETGANRTFSWDLPDNLAAQNDGNVDRLRIRVRDSNNLLLLDQRLASGDSLTTTEFTLPDNIVTHDGLYQAEILIEGFTPFNRSTTFEFFRVEDVSPDDTGVQVTPTSIFSARDNRGANSVNFGTGDLLVLAVDVNESVAGNTFLDADQGGDTMILRQALDRPTQFTRSVEYDPLLTGAWDITLYNGAEKNVVQSRAVGGVGLLEIVSGLTLTPNGLIPTLNWVLPNDVSEIDRIDIGLFNDVTNARIAIGDTDGLFLSLDPTATSFTFADGVLEAGTAYVARVILVNEDENGRNLSRSLKFVNFTPILGDAIDEPVNLPTVDGQGVFNFDFDVAERVVVRIDPFVAVGYEFATGAGDPNFESIELPVVGSDFAFIIQLFDGTGDLIFQADLEAEFQFFFDIDAGTSGGVSSFTILGIDPDEGLDPTDGPPLSPQSVLSPMERLRAP